jgi:hypothetical protein
MDRLETGWICARNEGHRTVTGSLERFPTNCTTRRLAKARNRHRRKLPLDDLVARYLVRFVCS